jgi:hypothetical protein
MDKTYSTSIPSVAELVRKAEQDYISGETSNSKYVSVSMYETLNRIDAYLNSKHTSGPVDSRGREKPFFNIVTAAVNVWYRATDLDRKHMKIRANKAKLDIAAFLATIHLQEWMIKVKFGVYLNKLGRTLAKYGSAVSKFVEADGKLHCQVIPWSRIICDQIDFYANPVIEKLQFTPAQLRRKEEYDQDEVERLIWAAQASRKDLGGNTKDNRTEYIELYELHGDLPLSHLTDNDEDDTKYQQQMHVISYLAIKDKDEYDDFSLYKGREAKSPYDKDDLLEEDDQTLSIGAVQNLFDAQWMVNHSAKQIKDALDIASKIVFQSSDDQFLGSNVHKNIESGDFLVHKVNEPVEILNTKTDITQIQAFQQQWQTLGNQINNISEAALGVTPKSGTPWRQTRDIINESYSLFEQMTESKGLTLEAKMRERIIPHIKKQMDTTDEISATLDSYGIDKIDAMYIPNEAIKRHNEREVEKVLNGQDASLFDQQAEQNGVRADLQLLGNQRFFKPSDIDTKNWKESLKDLEWEFEIDVTQEQRDLQLVMQTLDTALKYITSATPEQLADPNFKLVFNEILRATSVISPIQIDSTPPPPREPPAERISKTLNSRDLPPEGKTQLAGQAGIQIQPPKQEEKIPVGAAKKGF